MRASKRIPEWSITDRGRRPPTVRPWAPSTSDRTPAQLRFRCSPLPIRLVNPPHAHRDNHGHSSDICVSTVVDQLKGATGHAGAVSLRAPVSSIDRRGTPSATSRLINAQSSTEIAHPICAGWPRPRPSFVRQTRESPTRADTNIVPRCLSACGHLSQTRHRVHGVSDQRPQRRPRGGLSRRHILLQMAP